MPSNAVSPVKGYLKFLNSYLENYEKRKLYILGFLAAATRCLLIIIPIIIREAFYLVDTGEDFSKAVMSLLIGIALYLALSMLRAAFGARLNIKLKKSLQLRILSNSIRYKNHKAEARGAGAFISTVYGDVEQVTRIVCNLPVFSSVLDLLQVFVIAVIASSWSMLYIAIIAPMYLLLILVLTVSMRASKTEFSHFREL